MAFADNRGKASATSCREKQDLPVRSRLTIQLFSFIGLDCVPFVFPQCLQSQRNDSIPKLYDDRQRPPKSGVYWARLYGIIRVDEIWRTAVAPSCPGVSRFFVCARACLSGRARFSHFGHGSCAFQSRAEVPYCRLRPGKSGSWRGLAPQNAPTPALRPLVAPDARH